MDKKERIVAAAVLHKEKLYLGDRHHECIHAAYLATGDAPIPSREQGFVTSEARFVGREEAGDIAWAAGQTAVHKSKLTSEDLW